MRLLTAVLISGLSMSAQADNVQALTAEGLALIPAFQQQLMGTVKAAMSSGGAAHAVEACQLSAPQIASEHSQKPWTVGRTALKVRNPDNAPDAWEREVLAQFAQRAAGGEPLEQISQSAVVGGEVRVMKAIGTAEPCLACHGKQIEPALAQLIDVRYPQDQARGFAQGELRGAFTLRRPVD